MVQYPCTVNAEVVMKMKRLFRGLIFPFCLFLVFGCNGSLLVSMYTSDMIAVAKKADTVLYTNATVVASGLNEDKDIEFLRNTLNSFGNERMIEQDYSEALSFTIKVPIVNERFQGTFDSSKDLLFIYADENAKQIDLYCKYNDEVLGKISDYLESEYFQTFDWNDLALSFTVENDLQDTATVLAYSSYVNGEPCPFSTTVNLERRDSIDIEFSNVLRSSIVNGKKQLVVSLMK